MNLDLEGTREVDEALGRLGLVAGSKVIRAAEFAATKPIVDEAKRITAGWPDGSGSINAAIGRTFRHNVGGAAVRTNTGTSLFTTSVGPRVKSRAALQLHNLFYRRRRRGVFHGHFLEWGHRLASRLTGRLARRRRDGSFGKGHGGLGRSVIMAFMRPALERKSLSAVLVFQNQMRRRVERALKKQDAAAKDV